MRQEPISAADLVRNTHRQLSRYARPDGTLTEVSGRLSDVRSVHGNDILIFVRPIDGLPRFAMTTATIHKPRAEIDALLEQIGVDGPITLVGMAVASTKGTPELKMDYVHTVNGTPTTAHEPRTPGPAR